MSEFDPSKYDWRISPGSFKCRKIRETIFTAMNQGGVPLACRGCGEVGAVVYDEARELIGIRKDTKCDAGILQQRTLAAPHKHSNLDDD